MSWGLELWDQRDHVEKHTQQGIDFLDKCANFVKSRSKIEQDYAKELRKLVKSYSFRKKEEDNLPYSYQLAFKQLLSEVDDYAGQHERISETLQDTVFKAMHHLSAESKVDRKKHLHELSEVKANLDSTNRQMQNARKDYEKANKESDIATKEYDVAAKAMDLTKAQILKFQNVSKDKGQITERLKNEYLTALENFNRTQTLFYEADLPKILDEKMQNAEETRITKLQGFFKAFTESQRAIIPIIHRCLEGMDTAADTCDPKKDSLTLIDIHKTGHQRPADVLFEDNGKPQTLSIGQRSPKASKRVKTGLFRSKEKSKALNQDDLADDFSNLPPEQRRKKFHKQIKEYEDQVAQLTKARDGMVKMSETCEQFGGDIQTIRSQLDANAKEIDKSSLLLHQYKCYLAVMENLSPPPAPDSMSNSNSMQNMQNIANTNSNDQVPPAPPQNDITVTVPPPPVGISGPPVPPPPPIDEFDEPKCTVLYDFEGNSEGELTVSAGEELVIVEDDGGGWTLVARGTEEGYVPTSYVEKL